MKDSSEKLCVVISSQTRGIELDVLAVTAPAHLLVAIAHHANTPARTLTMLAADPHADVRSAVGEHPNTPGEVLLALAQDRSADVRFSLAENHNLNTTILRMLAGDENPYVAARAQRTLARVFFALSTKSASGSASTEDLVPYVACA